MNEDAIAKLTYTGKNRVSFVMFYEQGRQLRGVVNELLMIGSI